MTHRLELQTLTDEKLLARLTELALKERRLIAEVIAHMAEVDARKLYLPRGHSSMFTYCTDVLGWSRGAAYHRIQVARAAQRFPRIIDELAAGRLHVSGAAVLAPHLRGDNADELVAAARGKSKRAIEKLVADRDPRPAVPTKITPLGDGRFAVRFTASARFCDKLEHAQALLSHSIVPGDVPAVLERALDAVIAQVKKTKLAATTSPRRQSSKPVAGSRHIPAPVKRAVVERDGNRCTFVSDEGRRCSETAFLEFHHQRPHALGGLPTVNNMTFRCGPHNGWEGERDFPGAAARARKLRAHPVSSPPSSPPPTVMTPTDDEARSALHNLGFTKRQARDAVAQVRVKLAPDAPLETVLRDALRALYPAAA